jgi:hypothetical protein
MMSYFMWQLGIIGIAVLYCIFSWIFSLSAKK